MLHNILHKPRGISKSKLISFINFIECLAASMMTLILPLFLFEVFQSESTVGQIFSVGAIASLFTIVILGWLLKHFSRTTLYKIAITFYITAILFYFFLGSIIEGYTGRILFVSAWVITPAILSLYLRDLTKPNELPKEEGIYYMLLNIGWVVGPLSAGFLMNYFSQAQENLTAITPILGRIDPNYFQYVMPFIIAIIIYIIALSTFILGKFVIKHPHLQEKEHSHKSNEVHHHKHLSNIFDYFKNTKRTLSFINSSFIAIWWVFSLTFLSILLESHNVSKDIIGIIIGSICLPIAIMSPFIEKFVKRFGSIKSLFIGYMLFFLFVASAFLVGTEHIYIFSLLLILSQIGVGLTNPLEELMYFEGTDASNEEKFYATHLLGKQAFGLLTPFVLGLLIAQWGITQTFYILPFLFIPLFGFFAYVQIKNK